jgi:acyl-coenzyme A synthetase/AMP-(fatty) acid ligase
MNFIEDVLERFPASKPALVTISRDGERRVWHFGELIAMSAGVSGALAARGVRRGDVVMTLVGNRIEWVLTMLACWRMGAVALPCNTQLRRHDLELRVTAASPALCVGEEDLLTELPGGVPTLALGEFETILDEDRPQETPASVADLDPEDPALVVFTSGTTGEPRGALHVTRYLTGQRAQAEHWLGARADQLVWCTTATGWSKSARNVFVAPWLCGAAALICDARFEPGQRLDLIEREEVNVLCQAPTEYRILAKRAALRPLPKLGRMVSAGEALNPEVIEAFRDALGLNIHDGYGQTETGHLTGNLVGAPIRAGSMGRALPGFDLRVAGDDAAGGELQVRVASCPTFFSRYLDEEPGAVAGRLEDGEWWPTGDIVRRDGDGYLWYEGRDDDLITSAGYRIGPFEVESALLTHPAVVEAAAVPDPDPERGAVVRAIVVLRDGEPGDRLAAELREHVMDVTAPYKAPRIVEFADELPKTASGKIKRAALRRA